MRISLPNILEDCVGLKLVCGIGSSKVLQYFIILSTISKNCIVHANFVKDPNDSLFQIVTHNIRCNTMNLFGMILY